VRPQRRGKYRQKVQLFDVPESTQDSYGQPSTNGVQIMGPGINGTFSAMVEPLKGDEILNVRQMWPTATHNVRMLWLGSAIPTTNSNPYADILPRMYLVDTLDGSQLNILFAGNIEKRDRGWKLICEEKVVV
jgi:hypothetical protein